MKKKSGPGVRKATLRDHASAREHAVKDARIPPPGSVIEREYAGRMHRVKVLSDGFEWRRARFTSLSTVALAITGVVWNGYQFFRLRHPDRKRGRRVA